MKVNLKKFINPQQLNCINRLADGEDGAFFRDKLMEIAKIISNMPRTYQKRATGPAAIAYLHYFAGGSANWYIIELDKEKEQHQAFGLADLFRDGGELGYISIVELLANGAEIDLHWTPKTLAEIKALQKGN